MWAPQTVSQQPIIRRPLGVSAPLSLAQQQVWLHAQLAPDIPLYNEVLVLERADSLDRQALERSFSELTRRHETLRTTLPAVNGTPIQMIGEHRIVELPTNDLGDLPDGQRTAEVLRIARQEARQPFDLTKGPLMRARLLRLSEQKYLLVVVLHTLIADEWSLSLLARELGALYQAYSGGEPSPLSDLPFQFADYAVWQREQFNGDLLEQHISYWRKRLADTPSVIELPTDRPRPRIQGFRGARKSLEPSKALSDSLKKISDEEQVTLFVTLLAAFQTLLSRYTGQDDIVVGSIVSGRDRLGTSDLIGLFAHTVITRTNLAGDLTFRQLLGRVGDATRSDYEHQNVPIDRLVSELQPERDPSRNPVFQVLFSLAPSIPSPQSSWHVAEFEVDTGAAKMDLQLQLYDKPEGILGHFTYNTDLFDAGTIDRMALYFHTLLQGIAANPDQILSRLPLLSDAERHQLLVEWNSTQTDYPRDRGIHQLFEAQVRRTPDARAVVFENKSLTYQELNRRANQLAHYLQKLGVGPDVLVGICVERSIEMVVGLLGILKTGGAYVPLDPAYPHDRLSFMLNDAEVSVLLTQKRLVETLPENGERVVCLDTDWHEIARENADNPASKATPECLAYVIYTSGSTGKPKGVQIPHRAVVNFLTSMSQKPGMTSADRLLAVTTLSFDIAGLEIYLPLCVGALLEIASREVSSDASKLLSKLAGSVTTVMQATPATWRMLLEAGWEGNHRLKALCGGEALSRKLADELLQRTGSLWNMYGPTETTIWSATSKVGPGFGAVAMGKAIANTQIFVLDKVLQPTPIGVAGELYIGGDGLARGYLRRPELTAEKFVANVFDQAHEARLYKTGDLVRYLPNGEIEFLQRIDNQTKLRGFRIELGEIESVLRQHPSVNEAVVMVREDVPGDQRLTAYLVPNKGSAPAASELRDFLKEKLPAYMVPSTFVTLSVMPLTANGKVNRRALPTPEQPDATPQESFVASKDALESQLVKIWESILRVRPIGIRDNFFEIGGHSLLAVRIMQRIEEICGKAVPIATLFQAPTIEQLAVILRQKGWSPQWSSLVAIRSGGSKPPLFCVHGAGGAVILFYDLARYLESDQPVYALQAQKLAGKDSFATRVEDMALDYIGELRSVQPEGPYFLAGYSFGGIVALEMAQQLVAQGQLVPLVVLFDTFCPTSEDGTLAEKVSAVLNWLWVPGAGTRTNVSRTAKAFVRGVQGRLSGMRVPQELKQLRMVYEHAAKQYTLRVYPSRIILFRSAQRPLTQFRDPHAAWANYAGQGLEIHEIAGNHDDLLREPQVRSVAEQLKACLDGAHRVNRSVSAGVPHPVLVRGGHAHSGFRVSTL